MFGKQIRKTIAFAAVIAALSMSMYSCGSDDESSSDTGASSTVETTQAAEEETEEVTEEETTEEAEEETEEPETEAETEEETEEPETEAAEEEEDTEETGEVPTNIELIRLINDAFGMMTDGSDEGNIQAALDWDVIDEGVELDTAVTAEFLVSSAMRATGIVDGSASLDEIIDCAVERGVISDKDLSAIDLSKADEIVEKAKYAWTHQEFTNEITVELVDGVIDLTNVVPVEEMKIDGSTVEIPSEYASDISEGTVYILPKNPDTGEGGAYKAESVSEGENGYVVIKSVPAEIEEVYKSISSN